MQIDPAGQRDRRQRGCGPVGIQSGRVDAFPGIVVEVELHRYALTDAWCAPVAKVAAELSNSGRTDPLDGECEPVGRGVRQLEGEIVCEGLHVDWRGPESARDFVDGGCIRELQTIPIQLGMPIELHPGRREAGTEIDRGCIAALDDRERGGRSVTESSARSSYRQSVATHGCSGAR